MFHSDQAPPKEGRSFACHKIDFLKKGPSNGRNQAMQEFHATSKRKERCEHRDAVQFVTKVQIKRKSPTASPWRNEKGRDDNYIKCVKNPVKGLSNNRITPQISFLPKRGHQLSNLERYRKFSKSPDKADRTGLAEAIPGQTGFFPKRIGQFSSRTVSSVKISQAHKVKTYVQINALVRSLSKRLDQNSFRKPKLHRPATSFATPTIGEISLLLKGPGTQNHCYGDRSLPSLPRS